MEGGITNGRKRVLEGFSSAGKRPAGLSGMAALQGPGGKSPAVGNIETADQSGQPRQPGSPLWADNVARTLLELKNGTK